MIYGVFSDVHSNLEALRAVLSALKDGGASAYLCCGDLVGYGPDPNACLDLIRALPKLFVVAGNHDLAAVERLETAGFNQNARTAVLWTRDQLSADHRRFLGSLELRWEGPDFTLVHGTPRNPPEEYLLSPMQFRDNRPLVKKWPLFVGHSHMPLFFRFRERDPERVEARFLEEGEELLPRLPGGGLAPAALNPGSTGQPRDQDPRASCALYDSKRGAFRLLRVPYDIASVQRKILDAGLPEHLALRLECGQ